LKATEACPAPAVATTEVGAPGTVNGVAEIEFDDVPPPTEFTARMVMGYVVPFVKPVRVNGEVVAELQFVPPSTLYW
jgi:hypothetical protein